MIINSLEKNRIKIIIDETDLNNFEISLKQWISNSNQILYFLNKILKPCLNSNKDFSIKDFLICTYNFRVFSILVII